MLLAGAGGPARGQSLANLPPPLGGFLVRFNDLVAADRPYDDLPRLADAEAATVLQSIWAGAAGPEPPPADLATLATEGAVESAELGVLDTYVYFPAPSPTPIDYDRLATRFGPEVARSLAASITAAARLSTSLEAYRSNQPAFAADRTAQLRQPSLHLVLDAEKFMASAAVRPADAEVVAAAFGKEGEGFTLLFRRVDRDLILNSFQPLFASLDQQAAHDLEHFMDALRITRCGRLCTDP